MKAKHKKFQFMILSKTRCPEYILLIDSNVIKESADVEMLGLIVDNKLSFEKHCKIMPISIIQTPCTQANKKILNIKKARVLGNAFVDSQFNYASLIWTFC